MSKYFHVELKVNHIQGASREEIKSKVQACLATNRLLPLIGDSIKVVGRSQGGAKSKGAGKDYELRVAKALTSWWGGKPFRRTPNSGGWDKQVGDGQVKAAGDIIAPEESHFPFCVECKHRKEAINFFAESTGGADSSTLVDWWKQCERDAATVSKTPLLITQCGRVEYVGYRAVEVQSLFKPIITDTKRRIKLLEGGDYLFTIMLFEDFVTVYKPKIIKDEAGLTRPA